MRLLPFGASRFDVSVIGLGTWNLDHAGRDGAVAVLRQGLDAGMNHIDTAEM